MFAKLLAVAGLTCCLALPSIAVPISIVPDSVNGGTSSMPFASPVLPATMQQFTSAGAFSGLSGPAYLLSLDFSSPTIMAPGTTIVATNNVIEAGFSSVPLASLTTNQATNLSDPLTTVASSYSLVAQAGVFNWHIEFATPILYDPSQGNLVLQFTTITNSGVQIYANPTSPNTVSVFTAPAPLRFDQARLFQFNFDTVVPEIDPSSARLPLAFAALAMLLLVSPRRDFGAGF